MAAPIYAVDRDLVFRPIHPATDGPLAYVGYRDACTASFGDSHRAIKKTEYVQWLTHRVEEFPDGHVLALLRGQPIGQLELQVPYGSDRGYVNLFYVAKPWRRLGFGRRLHDFALGYFRSWQAQWIELHVARANEPAVNFYRSLGYRMVPVTQGGAEMWLMERPVPTAAPAEGRTDRAGT
jgi:GNAT superfamily N-acetyltransferase